MTLKKLRECPFCGSNDLKQQTVSEDERCGYNYVHLIQCACGIRLSKRTMEDKNGWCDEGLDSLKKRVIDDWNYRHGE